jgi:hypothetical protein
MFIVYLMWVLRHSPDHRVKESCTAARNHKHDQSDNGP